MKVIIVLNNRSFWYRLKKFGVTNIIVSPDFILSLIVGIFIVYFTKLCVPKNIGISILDTLIPLSAALFAIILAGLAIISSFTDEKFILAWVKANVWENLVTLFQINLYIPLIVILLALLIRFVYYNSILLIFLIIISVYMIFSLIDLIRFISVYALQRADFLQIKSQIEEKSK